MSVSNEHANLDNFTDMPPGAFFFLRDAVAIPAALNDVHPIWEAMRKSLEGADEEVAKDGGPPQPPAPLMTHASLVMELLARTVIAYIRRRGYDDLAKRFIKDGLLAKAVGILNEEFPDVEVSVKLLDSSHQRPRLPEVPPPQDGE